MIRQFSHEALGVSSSPWSGSLAVAHSLWMPAFSHVEIHCIGANRNATYAKRKAEPGPKE